MSIQIDTEEIISAFMNPRFYSHNVYKIEYVQTHISHIFMTGFFTYKLKKSINLGFLNYSSLESRRYYCLEELRLNRRLCPDLYLEVLAVVRSDNGLLALESLKQADKQVLEFCLKMVQMNKWYMLDQLAKEGILYSTEIQVLAEKLNDFYFMAQKGNAVNFYSKPELLVINIEENFRQTEFYRGILVSQARWRIIRDYSLDFLAYMYDFLESRLFNNCIRDGHGDLHLGNINLSIRGQVIIFDCIEFNKRFRYQDVVADLAFLAMDLDFYGRDDLSCKLVEHYVQSSGDSKIAVLINFYKCYRAIVRAKAFGFMYNNQMISEHEKSNYFIKSKAYFRLAACYARGEPAFFLVCIMGVMGTGKTYLARKLASVTGWMKVHSDVVRKQIAGLRVDTRNYDIWERGLYSNVATEATYRKLFEKTEVCLSKGNSIIIDASFQKEIRRKQFLELSFFYGAMVLFVEISTSIEKVVTRLVARQKKNNSMSDGRLELMLYQICSRETTDFFLGQYSLMINGEVKLSEKLNAILFRLRKMGYIL